MYGDFRLKLITIYHCHLIEKTGFLNDLFCKTKGQRALQSGPNRGVAYTQLKIQLLIEIITFESPDFVKADKS